MFLTHVHSMRVSAQPVVAAREWLRTQAVDSYQTSRMRLLIAERRIAGFYSLAAAQVELRQSDRRRAGFDLVSVPAALVTWIAQRTGAEADGKLLLLHAAGTARSRSISPHQTRGRTSGQPSRRAQRPPRCIRRGP